MYPIVHLRCDLENRYSKNNLFTKIKDKVSINLMGNSIIKELGLTITKVRLPPNFHQVAYMKNIERARRYAKGKKTYISPKTLRLHDFTVLNSFQRDLVGYSIVNSIQLILRLHKKSIKSSCIVIYDANDQIYTPVLNELCKRAKYVILLSETIEKLNIINDYILASYGITPVVTNDFKYSLRSADFIITNKIIETPSEVPIWYLDNCLMPYSKKEIAINDVDYIVPWENKDFPTMPPELVGAILSQMEERDIEKALKYNDIQFNNIKFNKDIIVG